MDSTDNKGIAYYLDLEYPYIVVRDEDEFFVRFPDLPGCMTQVERAEEIDAMAEEIKQLWLEAALEAGQRVPEPVGEEFSGKFVVRVPKTLHRDLVYKAKQEGMSLNSFVLYLLSERTMVSRLSTSSTIPKPDQAKSATRTSRKTEFNFVDHRNISNWLDPQWRADTKARSNPTREIRATEYVTATPGWDRYFVYQAAVVQTTEE